MVPQIVCVYVCQIIRGRNSFCRLLAWLLLLLLLLFAAATTRWNDCASNLSRTPRNYLTQSSPFSFLLLSVTIIATRGRTAHHALLVGRRLNLRYLFTAFGNGLKPGLLVTLCRCIHKQFIYSVR